MDQLNVNLKDLGSDFTTRNHGAKVRDQLADMLRRGPSEILAISFQDVETMTPSFVDECFGRLLVDIGVSTFKSRIKLLDADDTNRALLNAVLSRRAQEARTALPQQQ